MAPNSISRMKRMEERRRRTQLIPRLPQARLKDYENPLEKYSAEEFKKRYHLYKETAMLVTNQIKEKLSFPIKRGVYIPPLLQFSIALRYFSTGLMQLVLSDLSNVSQPTISNIVKRVSKAVASLSCNYIKWPANHEVERVREGFHEIAAFPGIVGCIDCTHIQIPSPGGEDAELFRNRKQTFSINVQAVCDHELTFTNLVARWYGSAHDMRIFQNSSLSSKLEDGEIPGLLLGDSGYACLPYLMTPLLKPASQAEFRYNKAQIKTRNTVERMFGVFKRRFPCNTYCRLKRQTVLTVIVATAVLHNIARRRKDIYEDDVCEPVPEDLSFTSNPQPVLNGRAKRLDLIERYFTSN